MKGKKLMFAVVEIGNKQYSVKVGDSLYVEKLNVEAGTEISIEKVIVLEKDGKVNFGKPFIKNAKVVAKVEKNGKRKKIRVFKYKPKKHYKKTQGHRQQYTLLKITDLKASA